MTLYIKAPMKTVVKENEAKNKVSHDTEYKQHNVYVRDVAKVFCNDKELLKKAQSLCVATFTPGERMQKKISLYDLFCKFMEENRECEVSFIEETEILIEYQKEYTSTLWQNAKMVFVSLICFFGAAFSIMSFHNDIGITHLFDKVYDLALGLHSSDMYVLEIFYSIGLSLGIILFFNHVGGKKITRDPTPVEVAMNNYEKGVNQTILEQKEREESL